MKKKHKPKHKDDYEIAQKIIEKDVSRETDDLDKIIQDVKDIKEDNGHLLDTEEDDGGFALFLAVLVMICLISIVVFFLGLFW